MIILDYIIPFLVVLTILVFIHELGHYLIARLNGIRVEVFSIGFGKEIIGWTDKANTRWKISILPLGGYVKLFGAHQDLRPPEKPLTKQEQKVAFDNKSLGQRAAVVFAGPLANFILAILLMFFFFIAFGEKRISPEVGKVIPNSVADSAGLLVGDQVLSVNSKLVESFDEILNSITVNTDKEQSIVVLRGNEEVTLSIANTKDIDNLKTLSEKLGIHPYLPAIIEQTVPNSPADKAGLQKGDIFLSISGVEVEQFYDVQNVIQQSKDNKIDLQIKRNNDVLEFNNIELDVRSVEKEGEKQKIGYLGVSPEVSYDLVELSFFESLSKSVERTYFISSQTLQAIYQMIIGKRSTEELGGPIRIAQLSGQVAELGLASLLMFMAILSINLGLINLFPIPLLDGGHLVLYAIEAVIKKPLSKKMVTYFINVGFFLIISLFLFTTLNDIMRFEIISNLFKN